MLSEENMKTEKFMRVVCLSLSFAFTAPNAAILAQQPDNTGANRGNAPSADQQSNNPADRDLAKKIRRSLEEDKNLSTYAHNVKVIVRDGEVTLKGPVKSEDEKVSVGSIATTLAGADKVHNELTVKAMNGKM
jgi:hyperosmotically inducible periplasmic protein